MRILIADDNDRIRSAIRAILSDEDGLEVCGEAIDGKQVLHQTRELLPDSVLLDVHLPDSDGFQITRKLRLEFPKIKILIMSHDDAAMVSTIAFQSGAADCIDKAYLATELASRLRHLQGTHTAAPNTNGVRG
jgi:DNA-binding NarL/FixJ family response regulator